MKVIVADKISERGVKLLKEQAGWNVVLTTKETLMKEIADADALIVRSATKVTPELLEKAPRLRVVGRAGVGVDNINLDEATRRGVLVMSTPGGNAISVAEHTFALMLAMARQVSRLDKSMHEGKWEKGSAAGTEVRGKTLGLIGLGRIGSEVAVRVRKRLICAWLATTVRATHPAKRRRRRCRWSWCHWRNCWRRAISCRYTRR